MARGMGRRRRATRARTPRDAKARLRASRELGEAYRGIQAIRLFYLSAASLTGLILAVLVLAGLRSWPWIGGILGAAVLLFTGGVQVRRQPVFWSVLVAVAMTILAALYVRLALTPYSLASAVVAAALWAAVFRAAPAQRLMRRHPDLYATEMWQGRRRRPSTTEIGSRLRTEQTRRARQRRTAIVVGVAVILLLGLGYWAMRRGGERGAPAAGPPARPFAERAADFRRAWNRNDLDTLAGFQPAPDRARRMPRFRRLLAKRDWETRLPELGVASVNEDGFRAAAHYPVAGADAVVDVYWEVDAGEWWWTNTRLPSPAELGR